MKKNKFIPVNVPLLNTNVKKNVNECLRTNRLTSGKFIKKFEKSFSKLHSRKFAISVSNGTAALEVAVKSLKLKKGSEVIIPNFSIISTALSVIKDDLKPIFVDCELETWNTSPEKIISKITNKTKAIIITHIYGLPVDMKKILIYAKKRNIKIIEDAAEVIGLKYNNQLCGSFGDISTFSFYANKHITTGEGGMIVTNNKTYYERCLKLRNICFEKKKPRFVHYDLGWNCRMTNMQAAVGCAQLKKLNIFIKKKRLIGKFYNKHLKKLKDITLPKIKDKFSKNIYWVYPIILNNKLNAKQLAKKLMQYGIETRPFFYPMNKQPILKKMKLINKDEQFQISEKIYKKGLYLPSGIGNTFTELKIVAKILNSILK